MDDLTGALLLDANRIVGVLVAENAKLKLWCITSRLEMFTHWKKIKHL